MRLLIILVIALASTQLATAQFGVGAGVAAMGDNVLEAGVNLERLFDGDSIHYDEMGGVIGGYVIGHFRYGYGSFARLNLDVGYVFFPSETIKITEVDADNNGAEFDVGASLIPIALGGEVIIPGRNVRPYLGAQVTYTVFNRTFAYVQGDEQFNRDDIRTEWSGRDRWGMAFRTGCEFALGGIALDVGVRYNIAELFHADDGRKNMNYLQVGASILFGDLLNDDDDEKKEADDEKTDTRSDSK